MKNLSIFFFITLHLTFLNAQNTGIKLPVSTLPNTTLDVNGSVAFREGVALTLVNGANTDVSLASSDYSLFRITGPTAAFSITGFSNGVNGRILTLINTTTQVLTLTHQATSVAANQINTGGTNLTLGANGVVMMIYNSTLTKWVVTGGQGFTSSAWSLAGNSGTTAGTNFIGTTDAQALVVKTSNTEQMRVLASGNVGIGTQTPQSKLDIEGGAVIGATYSGSNAAPTNGLLVEGNVGIGTSTSAATTNKLHVNATNPLRLEGLATGAATDKILTADGTGVVKQMAMNTISGILINAYNAIGTTEVSVANGSTVDVPGASVTFTTTTSSNAIITGIGYASLVAGAGTGQGAFFIVVDGTAVTSAYYSTYSADLLRMPVPCTQTYISSLATGTHTIKLQMKNWASAGTGGSTNHYINRDAVAVPYVGASSTIDSDALKSRLSILLIAQ